MILYATLALCAAVTGVVVYRYDLYDREPWWLLGACSALAAGAMTTAGRLESLVFRNWPAPGDAATALMAAAVEELAKLGVVAAIALVDRRDFNDPLDGLVYGSMAGLGAAVEESVAFLRGASPRPHPLARFGARPHRGSSGDGRHRSVRPRRASPGSPPGLGLALLRLGRRHRPSLPVGLDVAAVGPGTLDRRNAPRRRPSCSWASWSGGGS